MKRTISYLTEFGALETYEKRKKLEPSLREEP